MSLNDDLQRGRIAEALLENEVYVDSIAAVREAIIRQWESCPVRDVEGQHELKLMLKLLNDLTGNIKTAMETGKLAKIEVERDSKLSRFLRKVS